MRIATLATAPLLLLFLFFTPPWWTPELSSLMTTMVGKLLSNGLCSYGTHTDFTSLITSLSEELPPAGGARPARVALETAIVSLKKLEFRAWEWVVFVRSFVAECGEELENVHLTSPRVLLLVAAELSIEKPGQMDHREKLAQR